MKFNQNRIPESKWWPHFSWSKTRMSGSDLKRSSTCLLWTPGVFLVLDLTLIFLVLHSFLQISWKANCDQQQCATMNTHCGHCAAKFWPNMKTLHWPLWLSGSNENKATQYQIHKTLHRFLFAKYKLFRYDSLTNLFSCLTFLLDCKKMFFHSSLPFCSSCPTHNFQQQKIEVSLENKLIKYSWQHKIEVWIRTCRGKRFLPSNWCDIWRALIIANIYLYMILYCKMLIAQIEG